MARTTIAPHINKNATIVRVEGGRGMGGHATASLVKVRINYPGKRTVSYRGLTKTGVDKNINYNSQ